MLGKITVAPPNITFDSYSTFSVSVKTLLPYNNRMTLLTDEAWPRCVYLAFLNSSGGSKSRPKPVEIGRQQSEPQPLVFQTDRRLHPQAAKQEEWEERNKLGPQYSSLLHSISTLALCAGPDFDLTYRKSVPCSGRR